MVRTITVNSIAVGGCSGTFTSDMSSGNDTTFTITGCSNGASKDAFKGDITLGYTEKTTGLTKKIYGNIATKIE